MIQIMISGRNISMRHLNRTHRISVSWMHYVFSHFEQFGIKLRKTDTSVMCADIFTKSFQTVEKWRHACDLINHCTKDRLEEVIELKRQWWKTGKVNAETNVEVESPPKELEVPWLEHDNNVAAVFCTCVCCL